MTRCRHRNLQTFWFHVADQEFKANVRAYSSTFLPTFLYFNSTRNLNPITTVELPVVKSGPFVCLFASQLSTKVRQIRFLYACQNNLGFASIFPVAFVLFSDIPVCVSHAPEYQNFRSNSQRQFVCAELLSQTAR